MLKSNDIWLRIKIAQHDYGCAGDGHVQDIRQFSSLCNRSIRQGDEFIANVDIVPGTKRVPRHYETVSRHCAHCALAFFPAVVVAEVSRAA